MGKGKGGRKNQLGGKGKIAERGKEGKIKPPSKNSGYGLAYF